MTSKGGLTKEQLKAAVCEAIDRNGNRIIELGETILHHPEAGLRLEPDRAHRIGDEGGGLLFVEAGLGVVEDRLAQFDDPIAVAVDRLAHRLFELFLGQSALAGHPALISAGRPLRHGRA